MPVNEEQHKALEARVIAIEKAMAVDEVMGRGISARLDKIEDTLTWLVRLIGGAIIMAAVSFALTGGFQP
jgi:hypothetical protein